MILTLAAGAVGWVIVEIAFAYHGWPALGRYMFEPAAIGAVLAGVGVGLVLAGLPRLRRGIPRWAGIPVVAVLVAALVPGAVARIRDEHRDLRHERARTHQIALLQTTTKRLGRRPPHRELRPARHGRRLRERARVAVSPQRRLR